MNIQEDYVSFEIAKLLKEKGFDIPCDYAYNNKAGYFEIDRSNFDEIYCFRPSLALAMKWLREVHKQPINLWYDGDIWSSEIYRAVEKDFCLVGHFQSYEEAVEAAIKYCLEHLI